MDADVVVIGAGVAGLRCAQRLRELGRTVVVVEASDTVGGRVRTDEIDGFRCDHGFQVLNPAYPAVKEFIDVPALNLQKFAAGVLVRRTTGLAVLADPRRAPRLALRSVTSGLLVPGELKSLAAWIAPTLRNPQAMLLEDDASLHESLDAAMVTGALRREVLTPFLAGVLADGCLETSARFAKLVIRAFALGTPGLPLHGMQALPQQMAAGLGESLRLNTRVVNISEDRTYVVPPQVETPSEQECSADTSLVHTNSGSDDSSTSPPAPATALASRSTVVGTMRARQTTRLTLEDGTHLSARSVVVATSAPAASELLQGTLVAHRMRGLVTWWFSAPTAPHDLPLVAVDGRRDAGISPGPVWNAAVITNAAPTYAPYGKHLVQATTLLDQPDGDAPESDVLAHLASLYGTSTRGWEVVTRHRIVHALPAMTSPLDVRRDQHVRPGVYVCGDHRDTASIQGALVSGQRCAETVHAALR